MLRCQWLVLILGASFLIGCGGEEAPQPESQLTDASSVLSKKDDKSSTTDSAEKSKDGAKASELDVPNLAKLKALSAAPKRDSVAGRWIFGGLQIQQGDAKNPPIYGETSDFILSVQLSESDPMANTATMSASREVMKNRQLKLTGATATTLSFECIESDTQKKVFDYSGKLLNGHIVGTLITPAGEIAAARLMPTEERTFARVPGFRPFEEQRDFMSLRQSAVPDEDLKGLAKQFASSPMLKIASLGVVEQSMQQSIQKDDLNRVLEQTLALNGEWGPQAKAQLLSEACSRLILSGYDEDFIEKWLHSLADAFEEAGLKAEGFQKRIASMHDVLKFRRCINGLDGKTPESREIGRKFAKEILQKHPFNAVLQWKLADANREDKRIDEALGQYAELAVLPSQELLLKNSWARERSPIQNTPPTERVAQLWKEKNGKADGLDEYLDQVYEERLLSFVGEPITKREKEDSTRVVLAEIFVGARCDLSVSADVAVAGLEKVFPQSMFIALRYHQHNPGHDPLVTEEGEARLYNFYSGQGTPTVSLNGHGVQQVGGQLGRVTDVFPAMKEHVKTELEKTTPFKIDLSAKNADGDIKIAANVTGEGLVEGKKRLRVVLAESGIKYTAPNGIRRHNMVVRQMVAGEEGVAVTDGKLAFEGQTNVEKLKQAQSEYLDRFGKNQRVEFPVKPLEFKNLSVVAWVQDEVTREVLQAAVVAVE